MENIILSSLPSNNLIVTPAKVLEAGSSGLREYFPDPDDLDIVVEAYVQGLHSAWIWSIALLGVGLLASLFTQWESLRPADAKKPVEAETGSKEKPLGT